jgi:hypothetical protein
MERASSFLRPLRRWALGIVFVSMGVHAQAPGTVHVALVIGNAAYPGAPLANPINDAKAIGEALKSRGFIVIEARDAGKAQMEEAVRRTALALKDKNGIGLLYYAGHGLQLDWRNPAKIEDMFKRVRLQVRRQSGGRQVPWESTSQEDDFYFSGNVPTVRDDDERRRDVRFSAQKADWDRIKGSQNARTSTPSCRSTPAVA